MTRYAAVMGLAVGAACARAAPSTRPEPDVGRAQFHTITSENVIKWERIHPRLGEYEGSLLSADISAGHESASEMN